MTPLLTFLIKSSISLALLYSLFRLIMRNEQTHSLNRFLLLGILLGSALIPFLNVQFFYEEIPLKQIEVVREFVSAPIPDEAVLAEPSQLFITEKTFSVNLWLLVYVLVISFLLIRLFIAIVKVNQIINKAEKRRFRRIVLAVVKGVIQPFTFLNRVVLSEKDFNENKDIVVAHELAHIKQMHAVDLVICELFTVMQFFNPFMWLLRRDLKLIHEYQADEAVLNKGIDAQKYQLLVLEKAVGERRFAMANHFTQKPILKRLKMMKMNKSKNLSGFRIVLFVPLIALLLMAFSKPGETVLEKSNLLENVALLSDHGSFSKEYNGFSIDIKKEGNYIDNKSCSLVDVVSKSKAWQKTGREDILLVLDKQIPFERIDEIRLALSNANVYHVNQKYVDSDEIIYPAGDVSKGAKFTEANWNEWWRKQLMSHMKDIPDNSEYVILYSFIIDKNGKVSNGHVVKGCKNPEINEAYNKALAQIPDWAPAVKNSEKVSVLYTVMESNKVR